MSIEDASKSGALSENLNLHFSDTISNILLTSGSIGPPKGVYFREESLFNLVQYLMNRTPLNFSSVLQSLLWLILPGNVHNTW